MISEKLRKHFLISLVNIEMLDKIDLITSLHSRTQQTREYFCPRILYRMILLSTYIIVFHLLVILMSTARKLQLSVSPLTLTGRVEPPALSRAAVIVCSLKLKADSDMRGVRGCHLIRLLSHDVTSHLTCTTQALTRVCTTFSSLWHVESYIR